MTAKEPVAPGVAGRLSFLDRYLTWQSSTTWSGHFYSMQAPATYLKLGDTSRLTRTKP